MCANGERTENHVYFLLATFLPGSAEAKSTAPKIGNRDVTTIRTTLTTMKSPPRADEEEFGNKNTGGNSGSAEKEAAKTRPGGKSGENGAAGSSSSSSSSSLSYHSHCHISYIVRKNPLYHQQQYNLGHYLNRVSDLPSLSDLVIFTLLSVCYACLGHR